jgi:hypothetical protein
MSAWLIRRSSTVLRHRATFVPVLVYDDVGAAADWLCATLGLTERFRQTDDSGQVVVACLVIGEGAVMLTPSRVGQGFASRDEEIFRQPPRGEVCHKLSARVRSVDRRHFRLSQLAQGAEPADDLSLWRAAVHG